MAGELTFQHKKTPRWCYAILAVIILVIFFMAGFLTAYYGVRNDDDKDDNKSDTVKTTTPSGASEEWSSILQESINSDNIRTYLRDLTGKTHLAGSEENNRLGFELADFWESLGLETVVRRYNVFQAMPNKENPSRIELQDGSGNALFTTQVVEAILAPEQNESEVMPPFNAYTVPGTPKGDLVYVNYGRREDFIWLTEDKQMNLTGTICIARYGKIFRGNKAQFAREYGAAGLILYSDPEDYAYGLGDQEAYPETWWLPSTGVQRGSLGSVNGDYLTPFYPAIDSAFRLSEDEILQDQIPVHPIGYGDAEVLLRGMAGEDVPDAWQGGINITYKLGPGFVQSDHKVQMFVDTDNNLNTSIYNVFGIIKGHVEPDRYVLLGNHRDAWTFGSVDPSSATAAMKELSRAFANMVQQGWKPRRTIIFCSWDDEEQSLVGSQEFVEEYTHILFNRAVAYLNVDLTMAGTSHFQAFTLPMLKTLMWEVAKEIPNPDEREVDMGHESLYDTWLSRIPERTSTGALTGNPYVFDLGGGSDHLPFIVKAGVTSAMFGFMGYTLELHPLYHTAYETFNLMDEIMDPGHKYGRAVAQFWGGAALRLADDAVLPLNVTEYRKTLEGHVHTFVANYGTLASQEGLSDDIDYLMQAIDSMKEATERFEARLASIDSSNIINVRMVNDQMMQLERAFIDPQGLPGRSYYRHVVFSPAAEDAYAGASFPALADALLFIENETGNAKIERWRNVQKQMSVLTHFIHAAARSLNNFHEL